MAFAVSDGKSSFVYKTESNGLVMYATSTKTPI